MKKFLFRGIFFRLLSYIFLLLTLFPHPRTNVLFSYSPSLSAPLLTVKAQENHPTMSEITAKNSSTPATGTYACILSDNTFFYANADGKRGLFLLPKSYYVRLVEYRPDYCKVEYQTDVGDTQKVIGYARTEDLTFVSYTPQRPYLYYVFDLRYKIEDTTQTDSTFLTEITLSCTYYGDYVVGSEIYCYVLRGDAFGYVPKPVTLQYEENTEYADYLASLQPPPDVSTDPTEDEQQGNSSPAQIAILVAICLLVPILAALVLKPPRRPPYETDD